MSSLESGFPSPFAHADEDHHPAADEPPAPPAPMQPFDEVQPLSAAPAQEQFQPPQPLEAAPVESFAVQPVEPMQLQPVEPPPALEPLQPTMPPPLPLLMAAEPAPVDAPPPPAAPPVPTPEEVANLGVPLGTLIFRAGLLTEEQLEDALQEGVRSGKRLGEVLLESGLIDERDLGRLLADQKGLRFVELSSFAHDPNATALLSAEKAHMFAALPVGFENGVPLVAVADPSNELVTENLRRALGSEPRLVVASRSDLHATIDRLHALPGEAPVGEPEPQPEPAAVEQIPALIDTLEPVAETFEPQPAEPVAEPELRPEPAFEAVSPAVEPLVEPAAAVPDPEPVYDAPDHAPEPEPAPPVLPPAQVEHVEPPQPESNGHTTVAPLVPAAPEPTQVAPEPEHAALVPEPAVLEPVVAEPVVEEPLVVEPVAAQPMVAEPVVPEPAEPVAAEPVAAEPVADSTYNRIEDEPPAEAEHEFPSALSYDVSLRLADGERVPIGSFGEPQKAREYARDVVKHLSDESDGWPFFSGRFMRPDTIVSVDIIPVGESDRWLGSSVRSNWASRLNH